MNKRKFFSKGIAALLSAALMLAGAPAAMAQDTDFNPPDDSGNLATPTDLPNLQIALFAATGADITAAFTDPNFLAAVRLKLNMPTGPIRDTDCEGIYSLDVSDMNISSLAGIEYFTSLETFNCEENLLTALPENLPDSLAILDCSANQLTMLPATLPNSLAWLSCADNQITTLPTTLPSGLTVLDCGGNQLASLPATLPDSLVGLACSSNQLAALPAILPGGLTGLDCSDNQLTTLPALPNSLEQLFTDSNQLASLPALPIGLIYLNANNNQLASLPAALPDDLQYLFCSENRLTLLPALPNSLEYLHCATNQLTTLPALPDSLEYFYCVYNQITSLPATLPSGLKEISLWSNRLALLPDLPSGLTYLDVGINQLTSLPALPNSLEYLYCDSNQLTTLPALPDSLEYLFCASNQLTSLPATFPSGLKELSLWSNRLMSLPALPAGLTYLDVDDNQLTSLPALPDSLEILGCQINRLAALPALPSNLAYLYCSFNELTSLPALPGGLITLYCSGNRLAGSLDLTGCAGLETLLCYQNRLTGLDVTGLASLDTLHCSYNYMSGESDVQGFTGVWDDMEYFFSPQHTPGFIAVTHLLGVPHHAEAGVPLTLTAIVIPEDAPNKTIVWEIADDSENTGARISGNVFTASSAGVVTVVAIIENADALNEAFMWGFQIRVLGGSTGPGNTTDPGSTTDDRGSSSSRSSGAALDGISSAPVMRVPVDVTTAQANSAAKAAADAARKAGAATATVNLKNPGNISLEALRSIVATAAMPVKLQADSMNGGSVDVRLTLDPSKAVKGLNLSGSTVSAAAKAVKAIFEKYYRNKLQVISLGQQGGFGQPVEIAAKVDLSGMDLAGLCFYSYNKATNSYQKIETPKHWIDKGGYLHFTTELAGDIIISDGPLEKK